MFDRPGRSPLFAPGIRLPGQPRPGKLTAVVDWAAKISVIGLFSIGITVALTEASVLILPLTAAMIFGLWLGPFAGRLERKGVPGGLGALFIILAMFATLYGAVMVFSLPLQAWLERAPELWSTLQVKLFEMRASLFRLQEVSKQIEEITRMSQETVQTVVLKEGGLLSSAALTAPSLVAQVALFFCALYFILATRTQLRIGILSICFTRRARLTAARIMRDAEKRVSTYLVTISLLNIALGLVVTAVMFMIGMPSPALWGALAAVLNYAEYVGPVLMVVLLTAVGLVTYDSASAAFVPAALYYALNFIEGQIISPALLGRRFAINPLLILVTIAFWLWVWGPVGALLAVPILIVLMVFVTHLALPHLAAQEALEDRALGRTGRVRRFSTRHTAVVSKEPTSSPLL
jgi:predicted PurR-regulated permease PerM